MTEPEPKDPIVQRSVEVLREWERSVDPVQAAKLAAARRRALEAAAPRRTGWNGGWQAAALAASLLLAVGIGFWPKGTGITPLQAVQPISEPVASLIESNDLPAIDEDESTEDLDDDLPLSLALSGLEES